MANPVQVRGFFEAAAARLGDGVQLTAHFHNTRGQGLANALAALESGVTSFESSFGELGGCPVPKGATGNIASEDLVSMLHEMGYETGIDLAKLLEAAREAQRVLGRPLGSHLLSAGSGRLEIARTTSRSGVPHGQPGRRVARCRSRRTSATARRRTNLIWTASSEAAPTARSTSRRRRGGCRRPSSASSAGDAPSGCSSGRSCCWRCSRSRSTSTATSTACWRSSPSRSSGGSARRSRSRSPRCWRSCSACCSRRCRRPRRATRRPTSSSACSPTTPSSSSSAASSSPRRWWCTGCTGGWPTACCRCAPSAARPTASSSPSG